MTPAADADGLLAAAEGEAADVLAQATATADATVEAARLDATRDVAAELTRSEARARRESRGLVLAAQRKAYDNLSRSAAEAAGNLDQRRYAALRPRLEALAVKQLGPGAVIEREPLGELGVVARSGSRLVDYRLIVVAQRCLQALSSRLEELWS